MLQTHYKVSRYGLCERPWLLAVTVGSLLSGVIMGWLGSMTLTEQQLAGFNQEVSSLLKMLNNRQSLNYFNDALIKQEVWLLKSFLLGSSCLGMPLIMALIFTKGFGLGYTIGVILNSFSVGQGILVLAAGVLPHNLLEVPLCVGAACLSAHLSLDILELVRSERSLADNPLNLRLALWVAVCLILGIGVAFIEGCLSPLLIRLLL
jgi:stage II sporulation protein M